ncbi:Hypothetical predicted protein [Octopus vulgaris]|uniref:Uncharacterized protein n=4 Tax=Octopus vulgaris TaxID=6645 RepID=A0AA36B2W4_OCTVU|nr:Hypothetical predicted protein [Octopus vulgaris]
MTEQREVKSLMEEYKWYDVGETRYAVIEKKNIGEFMGRCERENWEVKDIRMSDEFVENMNEYFGVRMDMEFIRIGKEHSSDYEKQRTEIEIEPRPYICTMTEQREVKSLMEEYKWYDVGETRYAVIEKKNIGEFMGRCERENWEVKDIRMSDEFVENMNEYFGVRMDMEFIRIGKEHSSDYEKQRTEIEIEPRPYICTMTEQREVKSLMEEYKWYDVGETRYAVIEKKNIGEFMGRCERENWEVKDIRMSDEFVENMNEYFGVRMDMEFIRIGKEHSSDYEKQRTGK